MKENNMLLKYWNRLKLRGRLLTMMLTVSLASVMICAAGFTVINNRIFESAREDTKNMSDTVHDMFSQLLYQQEMYLMEIHVNVQADYVDGRLAEMAENGEEIDWDSLAEEAYDLINTPDEGLVIGDLESIEGLVFILVEGELYVNGADTDTFTAHVDRFFERYSEDEGIENVGFAETVKEIAYFGSYTEDGDVMTLVTRPFDGETGLIGILSLVSFAALQADYLRELTDTETIAALDSMAGTARQSLIVFALIIAAILIALPIASGRLAVLVVNPVEREQERQRSLLQAAEEEKAMFERLDRMKTEFLQDMRHEMKNPLTTIARGIEFADNLMDIQEKTDTARSALRLAQEEALRVGRMVDSMINLATMTGGTENREKVNFESLLVNCAKTFRLQLDNRENTLDVEIDPCLPYVYGVTDQLKQVLINLFQNTAKHTRNSAVTLKVSYDDAFITVNVSDTGEGIPPEILAHVFERGFSGKERSGYGLSICRTIVEAHGGNIDIESEPGKGTAVTFTIPVYGGQSETRDKSV